MPPHLHPRSRLTSSLFATTLFASFFVVALPHALPCPAPRVLYADDGTPIPRKRRRRPAICGNDEKSEVTAAVDAEECPEVDRDVEEIEGERLAKRECPVPKPGGIVGEILGFGRSSTGEGKNKPP
jgi:cytochrome c oxidase assembly factor 2